MAISAVISFLGIPGWGCVHLALSGDGHPTALLSRLQGAWHLGAADAEGRATPAQLLAALLRAQTDLEPLAPGTLRDLQGPLIRHRLVCLRDRPVLVWRAWWIVPGRRGWCPCFGPLPLEARLFAGGASAGLDALNPEAGRLPVPTPWMDAVSGCERRRLAASDPASIAAAPLPASGHRHGAPDRLPAATRGL